MISKVRNKPNECDFLLIYSQNHSVQGRWDLENIIWYLGSDSKRIAPSTYGLLHFSWLL